MSEIAKLASLSLGRRRLLKLMQRLNFGRIEHLAIQDGEPLFDPPPHLVRDVKFCGENGPRRELALEDFALKAQVRDLFAHLDDLRTGTILALEVKHGLPFRMQVEEGTA